MSLEKERIQKNLESVRARIAESASRAGRDPDEVQLVAITKSVGIEEIQCLYDLGVRDFGENRLHLAEEKIPRLQGNARWHMIGHVQRRKARDIVPLFDCVDAIDRLEVAQTFEKHCAEQGKSMPVLIETNVSGEESKFGVSPDELARCLDEIGELTHLQVTGLMTMAPYVDDPEDVRPVFGELRRLAERFQLSELSMGMTNDFEIAIEEGATQVRIGSALFI